MLGHARCTAKMFEPKRRDLRGWLVQVGNTVSMAHVRAMGASPKISLIEPDLAPEATGPAVRTRKVVAERGAGGNGSPASLGPMPAVVLGAPSSTSGFRVLRPTWPEFDIVHLSCLLNLYPSINTLRR